MKERAWIQWRCHNSAAQSNLGVPLQPRAKWLTQMSLELREQGESMGLVDGGFWRSSASSQRPTAGFHRLLLDEGTKKNAPPVQIRSPNLHISSFPQCSLWRLCCCSGRKHWHPLGEDPVSPCLALSSCLFSHSLCLLNWDNGVIGGGDMALTHYALWALAGSVIE